MKLGLPEALPSGKIRWKKTYKKRSWKSSAFDSDSRRNQQDAYADFLEFKKTIDHENQAKAKEKPKDAVGLLREASIDLATTFYKYQVNLKNPKANAFLKILNKLEHKDNENNCEMHALMIMYFDYFEIDNMRFFNNSVTTTNEVTGIKTAKQLVDSYVQEVKNKSLTKQVGISRFVQVASDLKYFLDFYGNRSMNAFGNLDIKEYYGYLIKLIGEGKNQNTISCAHATFKTFISRMASDELIKKPSNIMDAQYRIPRVDVEPDLLTKDEVHLLLNNCSQKTKLYILLMLNCGMYQGDIAELTGEQVDWLEGRVIRPRSKRKKKAELTGAKVKKTNWILWEQTFELLKKHGNRTGICLTDKNGNSLMKKVIVGDVVKKSDVFHSAWTRLISKLKNRNLLDPTWNKEAMTLRKIGANVIEKSPFGEFYDMYLDHSSVARRNYIVDGKIVPKFDEAVKYYGKWLFKDKVES